MATTTTLTQAQPVLHLNGGVETVKTVDGGAPGPEYRYARFLPSFDQNYKLPPLEPFEHTDPGLAALNDPEPRSFLQGAEVIDLTPKFGSEVEGIQLSKLDQKGKRCAARRPPW
jgi:sulfonate dioxygenase